MRDMTERLLRAKAEAASAAAGGGAVPVVAGAAGLPAGLMDEMEGLEGAGTSTRADDGVVPFLAVLQDMSPEAKRRDPAYVEGAEAGCILNKGTRKLWTPTDECIVIPVAFQRALVEWVPRDDGGGMVGRYPLTGTPEELVAKLGGSVERDPRDSTGRKTRFVAKGGVNDLIDTRYQYILLVEDGGVSPAVMSFSSTGHQAARLWMTLQRRSLPGSDRVPPAWFRQYRAATVERKKDQNTWFTFDIQDRGFVENSAWRAKGREMFEAFNSGEIKAGTEDATGGARSEDDVPI